MSGTEHEQHGGSGDDTQGARPVEEVLPGGTGPDEADLHPGEDGHADTQDVGTQPGAIDSADEVDPERFDAG